MFNRYAVFKITWKIDWVDYDEISSKPVRKNFVTAHDNIAYHWHAEITDSNMGILHSNYAFKLELDDGPVNRLDHVSFALDVAAQDSSFHSIDSCKKKDQNRGIPHVWNSFIPKNKDFFQSLYDIAEKSPLNIRLMIKVPLTAKNGFDYRMKFAKLSKFPSCIRSMFMNLEDHEKSIDSDVQLVSSTGDKFYCHRLILRQQSAGFDATFRNAASDEEKSGIFHLPTVTTRALKSILEYFYTGSDAYKWFGKLSTTTVIEIADFAERYGMKDLKQECAARLWERVVEKPNDSFHILRFADLHDELRHLKFRAFDVMVDNYEKLAMSSADFGDDQCEDGLGLDQAARLREEFNTYSYRRVGSTVRVEKRTLMTEMFDIDSSLSSF